MNHTIFDDIVSGKMKSWKIWEDEKFLAFLTPFPNTPGFTVVIPKQNPGDYVFSLDDKLYSEMMLAVKKVAGILEAVSWEAVSWTFWNSFKELLHTIMVVAQKLVIKEAVLCVDREFVAAREIAKKDRRR